MFKPELCHPAELQIRPRQLSMGKLDASLSSHLPASCTNTVGAGWCLPSLTRLQPHANGSTQPCSEMFLRLMTLTANLIPFSLLFMNSINIGIFSPHQFSAGASRRQPSSELIISTAYPAEPFGRPHIPPSHHSNPEYKLIFTLQYNSCVFCYSRIGYMQLK